MTYRVVRISSTMDRSLFDCGEPALNEYFSKHARQNDKKRIATCFVFLDENDKPVGYYAFTMAQIGKESLPPDQAKGIPGYPIGAIRIGRLARDLSMRGKGFGEILLKDCLKRIVVISNNQDLPAFKFIIVDAKNNAAIEFYKKFGFIQFQEKPNSLVIPLETVKEAMK